MSFVAVVVIGGFSAYSAREAGKAQQAMAEYNAKMAEYNAEIAANESEYNAKIAENEALAKQQELEAEGRQLAKGQRAMKAKQRVSIGMRGGLQEGTDLLALAEQSEAMQLDQLELQRQQDIAQIQGASSAAMSRYQGDMSRYQGASSAAMARYQGKQAASSLKWISAGIQGGAQGYQLGK